MEATNLNHLQAAATRAFNGTSFDPEKRGQRTIDQFNEQLRQDIETITGEAQKYCIDPAPAIQRYKAKYEQLFSSWLYSEANCVSSVIAGPSNFPAARMQKRRQWAENHYANWQTWRRRVLKAIAKSFKPKDTPVSELERAKRNLAEREQLQQQWKRINAAHIAYLKDPNSLEKFTDLNEEAKNMVRNYKVGYSWEPHPIAPYRLSNNSQRISQLKKRVEELESKVSKAGEPLRITQIGDIKIILNYEIDRIQIQFPGKPSAEVISKLKHNGFHWSPSNKMWQRKLNQYAYHVAVEICK